jgi:GT2 family glycosyltransferase
MPDIAPDLSILIVNYKTPALVLDCLRSIAEHTNGLGWEVIVVDNESGDGSRERVMGQLSDAERTRVRWFDMGYNAGFARANNLAIKQARGRLLLLLNSDTLLRDNVLLRCAQLLDEQPDVAAVSPMQINRAGQVHLQAYEHFGDLLRHSVIMPGPGRSEQWLRRWLPNRHYADPQQVDFIAGSFVMTRQTTVEKAGRLDENFFMYGEDVEWSHRLSKQGRLLILRDAFYVHLEYGSDPTYQQQQRTHINRFKTQMQVSFLLWIRKQYGAGVYLLFMLHYLTLVPVLFVWKISINLRHGRPALFQLENQRVLAGQVGVFLRFFWPTLLNRPGFYKM